MGPLRAAAARAEAERGKTILQGQLDQASQGRREAETEAETEAEKARRLFHERMMKNGVDARDVGGGTALAPPGSLPWDTCGDHVLA